MSYNLSVGTIVDKNRIASLNSFIILMDAHIVNDTDGSPITTLSFCKNSENIVYNGVEYQASAFDIEIQTDTNSEPSITVSAQDQTRTLQQYIEAYAGLPGSSVTMTVVNSGNLSAPPEIQETFKVISCSTSEYVVTFTLGTDAAVNRRFPPYVQHRDLCMWRYKSKRCGYTGPLPKCDFSLEGSNGCVAHNNQANFGGFPGLNTSNV